MAVLYDLRIFRKQPGGTGEGDVLIVKGDGLFLKLVSGKPVQPAGVL